MKLRGLTGGGEGRFRWVAYSYNAAGNRSETTFNPFGETWHVDTTFPAPKLVEVEGGLWHMSKSNARQWRLGLTERNVVKSEIQERVRGYLGYEGTDPLTAKHLYRFFNPAYRGPKVWAEVWSGSRSVAAYNEDIWVGYDLYYPRPIVGVIDRVVGELLDPEGSVNLFEYAEFLRKPLCTAGVNVQ
jgi:hypothetical protein